MSSGQPQRHSEEDRSAAREYRAPVDFTSLSQADHRRREIPLYKCDGFVFFAMDELRALRVSNTPLSSHGPFHVSWSAYPQVSPGLLMRCSAVPLRPLRLRGAIVRSGTNRRSTSFRKDKARLVCCGF